MRNLRIDVETVYRS